MSKLANTSRLVLSQQEFSEIAEIAQREAGLVLVESKASMISSRLSKRLKALNIPSFSAYCNYLKSPEGASEKPNFISTLTTNVSHFFREQHHFDLLKEEVLPKLLQKCQNGERVRIWSAGCSNGQELTSIAITLLEYSKNFLQGDVRLLGTDIDKNVVSFAKKGEYSASQCEDINSQILEKYFIIEKSAGTTSYTVCNQIKNLTTFRELNLIEDWPMRQKFDIIFCRNVVIYFNEQLQHNLWSRFEDKLMPGGWLFLGHSERVDNLQDRKLESRGITAYQRIAA